MSYEKLYKVKEVAPSKTETPKVDVVFSFDTTGSMSSVIESVRNNLKETVERLFADIEGIRIGIIVHGDYCDYPKMMWVLQPTNNVEEIKEFIKHSPNTGGGDCPECYELVLHAATKIQWQAPVKVLVVIGDESPHDLGYHLDAEVHRVVGHSRLTLDWHKLAEDLKDLKVTVFSCHARPESNMGAFPFYEEISRVTGGYYFPLNQLQAFKDYMVAICLRAADSADVLALLEQQQRDLEERMKGLQERQSQPLTAEELVEVEAAVEEVASERHEYNNLLAGFMDCAGMFSPEAVRSAARIRSRRPEAGSTRLEAFEAEVLSSSATDASTAATFAILSDRVDRTATRTATRSVGIPTPTRFGSSDSDDDDEKLPPTVPCSFSKSPVELSPTKTPVRSRSPLRRLMAAVKGPVFLDTPMEEQPNDTQAFFNTPLPYFKCYSRSPSPIRIR